MCRPIDRYDLRRNITKELFIRVVDELFPTALIVDIRGCGESLIHPDFSWFLEETSQVNVNIKLITNLMTRREALLRELVEKNVLVGVSFDTTTPELFHRLRSRAQPPKILRNLKILLKNGFNKWGDEYDGVYLMVTVQPENCHELRNIVRLAGSLGIPLVKLGPLITQNHDPRNLKYYEDRVYDGIVEACDEALALGITLGINAKCSSFQVDELMPHPHCPHPWLYSYVNFAGAVGYCDHLIGPEHQHCLVGSLVEEGFHKIWTKKVIQQVRRQHIELWNYKKIIGHSLCEWCYENRLVDFEDLLLPSMKPYRPRV